MRNASPVLPGELASAVAGDGRPDEQFGRLVARRREHVRWLVARRWEDVGRLVAGRWEWFAQVVTGYRQHTRWLGSGRGVDVVRLRRPTRFALRLDVVDGWRTVRRRRLARFATVPLWFLRGLVR